MTRDRDGNREYKIKWRIACDPGDGPANALQTTGLPQPGEYYSVLGDNDSWATCKLDATVTPVVTGEKNTYFLVEQTFSSKGDDKLVVSIFRETAMRPLRAGRGRGGLRPRTVRNKRSSC